MTMNLWEQKNWFIFQNTEHLCLRTRNNLKFWIKIFISKFQWKDMNTPSTCYEAIPCESRFRGTRFFKVAVRPFILWNIQVWVWVFHCKRRQDVQRRKQVVLTQLGVCVQFSYRNPSSDLAPPLSVCAALSSDCFQLPGEHTKQPVLNTILQNYHQSAFIFLGGV